MVTNKVRLIAFIFSFSALLAGGLFFASTRPAEAIVTYSSGTTLGSNSVYSKHIAPNTILNADVSQLTTFNFMRLGVSTTSPRAHLEVVASSTLPAMRLTQYANANQQNFLELYASNTPLTLFNSLGQLGIATTSAAGGLRVQGDALVSGGLSTGNLTATGTITLNKVAYTFPSADGAANTNLSTNGSGVLSWQSSAVTALTQSLIGGDIIGLNAPVFATGVASGTITTTATQNARNTWGHTSAFQKIGEVFTTSSAITTNTLLVNFYKNGTPTDNAVFGLFTTSGGAPTGQVLAQWELAGGSVAGACNNETMTSTTTASLAANTQYQIVAWRSGTLSDVNNYSNCGDALGVSGDQAFNYDGASWASSATRWRMVITAETKDYVYSASASATSTGKVIGFATATSTGTGANVSVSVNGLINMGTILTAGADYYLGNATGTISKNPGTYSKLVGRAVSSTTLMLIPN